MTDKKNTFAKYEVPFNWSPEYLSYLVDNHVHISSVFGSLTGEPGGRPIPHSIKLSCKNLPNMQTLQSAIEKLNNVDIPFTLSMNASCYGGRNFSDEGKEWINDQIRCMRSIGIEWVTVSNFDLARRISAIAPDINIILSVMFNIIDLDAIAYAQKQDFNFAGLVLGKGLTRRIPDLERTLRYLESQKLKGILIANDFCPTANCPERMSDHNNICAHYHENTVEYVSPSIHCRKMSMEDPAHYLQAPVINPNDISFYESIGVKYFKLTDRVMPDKTLIDVCDAYFKRSYSGNLFELFTFTSYLGDDIDLPRRLNKNQIQKIYMGGYSEFKKHRSHFVGQPFADAKKLSEPGGFFDYFKEGLCTLRCGSRVKNIPGCYYCEDFAEKILEINQDDWNEVKENITSYIEISRKQKSEI